MNKKNSVYLALGGVAALGTAILFGRPAHAEECIEGDEGCVGYNLWQCVDGQWVETEVNSERCGYVPSRPSPTPTKYCYSGPTKLEEGEHICIGDNDFVCTDGRLVYYGKCGSPSPTDEEAGDILDIDSPIEAFEGASAVVTVTWRNIGDVRLSGEVVLSITDATGHVASVTSPSAIVSVNVTQVEEFDVTFNGTGPWEINAVLNGEQS